MSTRNKRPYFRGYYDFMGPFGAGRLSPHAQALLILLLWQYNGTSNNGSLKITASSLPARWRSNSMRQKARDELIANKFIFEVARGRRPNLASLYALACDELNHNPQHDTALVEQFHAERDAWRIHPSTAIVIPLHGIEGDGALSRAEGQCPQNRYPSTRDNADFSVPPHGIAEALIVPPHGTIGQNPLSLHTGSFEVSSRFIAGSEVGR